MNALRILLRFLFVSSIFLVSIAHASDSDEIRALVQHLYSENEKFLQCRRQDGSVDEKLIKIPNRYFSEDFMRRYQPVCLGRSGALIVFDIRTGDNGIYMYKDSKASLSNVSIGLPDIRGEGAVIRATYDLEDVSFKDWGNFSKFHVIKEKGRWKIDDIELGGKGEDRESMTTLKSIKSLKSYIDERARKLKEKKIGKV